MERHRIVHGCIRPNGQSDAYMEVADDGLWYPVDEVHEERDRWNAEIEQLKVDLKDAYAEFRKLRPAQDVIFDRAVWDRAMLAEKE